jgi:hypothetical protein
MAPVSGASPSGDAPTHHPVFLLRNDLPGFVIELTFGGKRDAIARLVNQLGSNFITERH